MIGDTFQGRITWLGGWDSGRPQALIGTVEHYGIGWILIRQPCGDRRFKRLSRATLNARRLCASTAPNIFPTWLAHDEDVLRALRATTESLSDVEI